MPSTPRQAPRSPRTPSFTYGNLRIGRNNGFQNPVGSLPKASPAPCSKHLPREWVKKFLFYLLPMQQSPPFPAMKPRNGRSRTVWAAKVGRAPPRFGRCAPPYAATYRRPSGPSAGSYWKPLPREQFKRIIFHFLLLHALQREAPPGRLAAATSHFCQHRLGDWGEGSH